MTTKYEATLDDFVLECETIEDTFEKAIAKYEFPYRDGALLEDMGQKARSIKVRCYFYGERYPDWRQFVDHLEKQDLFEFFHPRCGLIKVSVESVTVRHDDRQETAEVDISLVENLRARAGLPALALEGEYQPDVEAAVEEEFVALSEEQEAAYGQDIVDEHAVPEVLDVYLDINEDIISQVPAPTQKARNYVKEVSAFEKQLKEYLPQIVNPSNSLISKIRYATNLPGRMIGTISRAVERQARMLDALAGAPAQFLKNLKSALKSLERSFEHLGRSISAFGGKKTAEAARRSLGKQFKIAAAGRLALEAAYLYKQDQARRRALKKGEGIPGFDMMGKYLAAGRGGAAILNVNELEDSLADVRGYLQEAIDAARDLQSLRAMAESLLDHVNRIKLEREKIIEVRLDNEIPLHLICLKYGLPYNAAERIYSINSIKNPNFTRGKINIYAP